MRKYNELMAFLLSLSVMLPGCAVMNEDECRAANWENVGFEDGRHGIASTKIKSYLDACSEYVHVDVVAYNNGRKSGANEFCTVNKAWDLGASGKNISDICDVADNKHEFYKVYQRGVNYFAAHQSLQYVDDLISSHVELLYEHDLYRLHRYLDSNVAYLYKIRPQLEQTLQEVEAHGRDKDINVTTVDTIVSNMPYFRAHENAVAAYASIYDADSKLAYFDDEMRKSDRCLKHEKDKKSQKAKDCGKRYDCLVRNSRRLSRDLRDLINSLDPNVTPRKLYMSDYNCY